MEEGARRSNCSNPRPPSNAGRSSKPGTFRYAYFSPEGGALHCRKIASGLAEWLRANGANVYENARVVDGRRRGRPHRAGSGETMQADRIVVTAGAWVLKLFPELGGELKTFRTALAYVEPPADLKAAWEAAPVILDVGGKTDGYMIPLSRRRRHEIRLRPAQGADQRRRLEPRAGAGRGRGDPQPVFAADRPHRGVRVTDVVTCAYTFTADEKFFAHEKGRCLIVSACSGHGYKFGAAVGRRVAGRASAMATLPA